ncbi:MULTISPECIES: fumarate reductase subunit FrdD [unclassified Mycolicibacterium]|uniref:fumarate reductase subunit FrdD n=1 Tax=unclassified Mycolicibacterium TaxID=2636767 RepID=UPI0012DF4B8D|nr:MULTISPECIES: fumarate reductase subunit FrdD [unclassified Mycolicibacterium]MUL85662.1 fumarate reductase subunit FrdD [Mycolicibacterium sp. CBMA 329]MUL91539.1 fumarate reductase subunit FrdD [Mycolicibacterium sp. CBMA 331]MUM02221.1 fumarate reductase subunit FrdD [Mycolicibacterium sp. CBMA 334]MUM27320.1 fumarate reductase subunit FrdD [Mycolicibacterium sp. CBMA 295]MUM41171.1 fumarate reductase subunit FrdD [Mycolicibacterium sp. CBMA 247]
MSAPTRRSPEPYFWLLFSAGGMVSALALPMLMALFGVLFPLGLLDTPDPTHLPAVVRNPLTRIVLAGVFVLALFHWAHRFRFMLEHGLKLGRFDQAIAVCSYGTAALGSIAAIWILLTI